MGDRITAEYFARATLATRGDYGVARRADPRDTHQWYAYGGEPGWFSDEEMAADGWTPVVESGRLSLDRLEAAWETAETIDSTGIGEGDLCIERCADDHYEVFRADADVTVWHDTIRILSRAPREPWQDLADVLRAWDAGPADADADGMAKWFHERGMRVTGGDE